MRSVGASLLSLALSGCGSHLASGSSSGTEETGSEETDACASVLEPATFAAGPIVSPAPWVATAECPALADPLIVELPDVVPVTGSVLAGGVGWSGHVEFRSRDDQGQVVVASDAQTGFAIELLPGRYDVHAALEGTSLRHTTLLLEDLELDTATMLALELPSPIELTGSMTMDGQPAPDPYGYIQVVSTSTGRAATLVMQDGTYALTLSPGAYRFVYRWCDREMPLPFDGTTICSELGGPDIPDDQPRLGPIQDWAPFHAATLELGGVLDLDVPTVHVGGTVTIDGAAPPIEGPNAPTLIALRVDEQPSGTLVIEDGSFDARVVVGNYTAVLAPIGGRLPELDDLGADTHAEIVRASVRISAIEPGGAPVLTRDSYPYSPTIDAWRSDGSQRSGDLSWSDDGVLEPTLLPGTWSVSLSMAVCWPDLETGSRYVSAPLAWARELTGPTEFGEVRPEFAAVHLEVQEIGESDDWAELQLQPDPGLGLPGPGRGTTWFSVDTALGLDAHGYLLPGRYRVLYEDSLLGTVDVQHGTTVVVRPRSRLMHAQWGNGQPIGAQTELVRLYMRNLDTDEYWSYRGEDEDTSLPPGRYGLFYSGQSVSGLEIDPHDGFPDNYGARIGCFTIEG